MSDNRALDPLCAYFGIASRYTDAQGQEHQVPGTTKRAILAALGVAVGDAETEARSLEAAIDRDWQRILPPVVVLWEGTTKLQLPLTLPDEADLGRLRWALSEEQGATSEGTLDPRELASATRRSIARRKWRRFAWDLTPPRQPGYHRLNLYGEAADSPLASTRLIIAPRRCFVPGGVDEDHRAWGLATTLQGIRSARDWGIGDFTDLTRLLELCGKVGAGALATGPLHALFPGRPERSDPFEPSSRLFLNVLHLDVEAVPELGECEEARSLIGSDAFQAQLRALRAESLVDYGAVTRAKLSVLERLYRHFREHHLEAGSPRADAFGAFCRERGDPLRRFALFEALREGLADSSAAPADWPEAYRRIDSQEVADFAHARAARVDFFAWLQWLAHQQLEWAGHRSLELRLALGLCPDLALGAAPDGAEVWAAPGLYVGGVRIASPPGDDRSEGRDSAALPWHPAALRDAAYAPPRHHPPGQYARGGGAARRLVPGYRRPTYSVSWSRSACVTAVTPTPTGGSATTWISKAGSTNRPSPDCWPRCGTSAVSRRCPGLLPRTMDPARPAMRRFPGQPTGSSSTGDSGFGTPPSSCPTWRTWGSATAISPPIWRPAPAAPTGTTSSPTTTSTPSSEVPATSSNCARPWRTRVWARSWIWCPTMSG